MLRFLAAVMLVLFASLNAMERVCCPDGCTHEPQSSSERHAPDGDGACFLCLGGVDTSVQQDLSPSSAAGPGVVPPPLVHYIDALPDSVEHPPRT